MDVFFLRWAVMVDAGMTILPFGLYVSRLI
jgi:hypothetical protein